MAQEESPLVSITRFTVRALCFMLVGKETFGREIGIMYVCEVDDSISKITCNQFAKRSLIESVVWSVLQKTVNDNCLR